MEEIIRSFMWSICLGVRLVFFCYCSNAFTCNDYYCNGSCSNPLSSVVKRALAVVGTILGLLGE